MPPSVNQMWASVRGRLIKSAKGRQYEMSCHKFKAQNMDQIREIKSFCSEIIKSGMQITVDCYFVFPKDKVFSKTNDKKTGRAIGDIKKIDVDNRLKPLLDELSKMLEIDDKHFFSGWREKTWSNQKELSGDEGKVLVTISSHKPRHVNELESGLLELRTVTK